MLILRKPWDSQPQEAVNLLPDSSAAVAQYGRLAAQPGGVFGLAVAAGSPSIAAGCAGIGPTFSGGAQRFSFGSAPAMDGAEPFTIEVLCAVTSVPWLSGFFNAGSGASSGARRALIAFTGTNNRNIHFWGYNVDANSGVEWRIDGSLQHVFVTCTGGVTPTCVFYRDGVQIASVVATGTLLTTTAAPWTVGDVNVGWNASPTGTIFLSAYHRRILAAGEISKRTAAPWGLFEPRRIIVPVAAAAPSGNTIAVPVGSLTLTGFAPTVTATANQVVAVPAGTLTLAGQTPTVTSSDHQTISVPAGTLTLTANAPTVAVSANQSISIPAGALTLTGQTPTVAASDNQSVAVPAGALTLTGLAPNVLNGAQQVVQVPLGTLTLTGQTPTVAVSANQVIAVPAGTLTLTGQTPTVVATDPQLISVPLGTLTLTGLVPTVSNVGVNNQISVPLGTLTMSGGTPVVRVSTDADVFIDRFAARSRITQSLRFGSRITTQVGLRSSLKD